MYAQSLSFAPSGRFFVVVGDREFVITPTPSSQIPLSDREMNLSGPTQLPRTPMPADWITDPSRFSRISRNTRVSRLLSAMKVSLEADFWELRAKISLLFMIGKISKSSGKSMSLQHLKMSIGMNKALKWF